MLKLNKLTLNNFMCVEHAELDFNDGVNLIVGNNGQGKYTVLQAVALCLLEDKRSDRYQEFIMLGKESCSVSLDAEIKGAPVKININLNKKSSGMERNAVCNGKTYVNSQVTDLLDSFDIAYYADIIMSMQNEGDITKLKPTEREAYLQKLFQFDFTEKVDKLKEDLTSIKESIDYQNAQIEFNTKSIEERKTEIKELKPLSFQEGDIQDLNNTVKELNDELAKTADLLKKKDEILAKRSETQTNIYAAKQKITGYEHDIEMIKSNKGVIDTLNQKLQDYDTQNASLEEEKARYQKDIGDLKLKLELQDVEKQGISNSIADQHDLFLQKTTELNEINIQLANKVAELSHAQKHIDMIKLGTCPECGHAFDRTDHTKYNEALSAATNAKEEVEQLKTAKQIEVNNADANVKALREKLRNKEIDISNTTKDISTLEYKIKNIDSQIQVNTTSKARIEEQIKQYSANVNEVETIKSKIAEENEVLTKLNNDLDSYSSQLTELDGITTAYTEKQSNLMQLQQKISDYNNEIVQNNLILQNNENIKKSIEDMTKKIEESKTSVESYRRQKATYDEAITLLDKTFPAWLILKTCQMLEHEMNSFIQVIFPEMAVKLFQNKRGVEFFYTTNINDGRIQTKENLLNAKMASGFEKAILSIAFKVALCRAYDLRFAFMDEIDQAGTEENSESLFKAILSNDLFDQLFVISHKPTVRDVIHSFAPSLKTFYVQKGKFWSDDPN